MILFRTLLLAGTAVVGTTAASMAADSSDHRRIQSSIYDVVRGDYYQSVPPIMEPGLVEGRAATAGPPPMDEWQRQQRSSDPYYFRHGTENHD